MKIRPDLSALGKTKWYEYALRFAFGGAITVAAGLIANKWGPGVGGLFLAFPAIFPASATLVEKHEKTKKKQHAWTEQSVAGKPLVSTPLVRRSEVLVSLHLLSPYGGLCLFYRRGW
jgi:hypothetical protein